MFHHGLKQLEKLTYEEASFWANSIYERISVREKTTEVKGLCFLWKCYEDARLVLE